MLVQYENSYSQSRQKYEIFINIFTVNFHHKLSYNIMCKKHRYNDDAFRIIITYNHTYFFNFTAKHIAATTSNNIASPPITPPAITAAEIISNQNIKHRSA